MAEPRAQAPVLLVIAAFSRYEAALRWARERLELLFGAVALTSPTYDFVQTAYYTPSMGLGLRKHFLVFRELAEPEALAEIKLRTNQIERDLVNTGGFPEERPLNLDPGFLSLGKFSLATTKDQAHRIYLHGGIFAENTLRFKDGAFEPWPWTYADYRLPVVRYFLKEARDFYRQRLAELKRQVEEVSQEENDP